MVLVRIKSQGFISLHLHCTLASIAQWYSVIFEYMHSVNFFIVLRVLMYTKFVPNTRVYVVYA